VLLSGGGGAKLSSIRLGGVPPQASLAVAKTAGAPPFMAEFDASGSQPGEGDISSFEWDFDADGVIDLNTGTSPFASYEYSAEGFYEPRVRVTNSGGEFASSSHEVRVVGYWRHSFGASGTDNLRSAAVDPAGNIYLCGYYDDPGLAGVNYRGTLIKLDPFGQLLWSRKLTTSGDCLPMAVAVDAEGNVIVAGQASTGLNDPNILVCKWDPDGQLLWERAFDTGTDGEDRFSDLVVHDTDSYICGVSDIAGDNNFLVLGVDGSGDGLFQTLSGYFDSFGDDVARSIDVMNAAVGISGLTVMGESKVGTGDTFALRLDLDTQGELVDSQTLSSSGPIEITAIDYRFNPFGGGVKYCVAGRTEVAGQDNVFFVTLPNTGASLLGSRCALGAFTRWTSLRFDDDANLLAAGYGGSPNQGWLAVFSASTGLLDKAEFLQAGAAVRLEGAQSLAGGTLVWGSSPDLELTWAPQSPLPQPFALTWEQEDAVTVTEPLIGQDQVLVVGDPLSELALDIDAGASDMFLEFRARP
jgi:hypothetical protein